MTARPGLPRPQHWEPARGSRSCFSECFPPRALFQRGAPDEKPRANEGQAGSRQARPSAVIGHLAGEAAPPEEREARRAGSCSGGGAGPSRRRGPTGALEGGTAAAPHCRAFVGSARGRGACRPPRMLATPPASRP